MALIEQRRILALNANQQGHVLDLMDAITLRAEDTIDNLSHYLGVVSARGAAVAGARRRRAARRWSTICGRSPFLSKTGR